MDKKRLNLSVKFSQTMNMKPNCGNLSVILKQNSCTQHDYHLRKMRSTFSRRSPYSASKNILVRKKENNCFYQQNMYTSAISVLVPCILTTYMKTAKLKLTLSRIFRCFLDIVLCDNFSMFILFNISSGKLL